MLWNFPKKALNIKRDDVQLGTIWKDEGKGEQREEREKEQQKKKKKEIQNKQFDKNDKLQSPILKDLGVQNLKVLGGRIGRHSRVS